MFSTIFFSFFPPHRWPGDHRPSQEQKPSVMSRILVRSRPHLAGSLESNFIYVSMYVFSGFSFCQGATCHNLTPINGPTRFPKESPLCSERVREGRTPCRNLWVWTAWTRFDSTHGHPCHRSWWIQCLLVLPEVVRVSRESREAGIPYPSMDGAPFHHNM